MHLMAWIQFQLHLESVEFTFTQFYISFFVPFHNPQHTFPPLLTFSAISLSVVTANFTTLLAGFSTRNLMATVSSVFML